MKVPLIDLQAQYASVRETVRQAVDRVFESQQFVMGPEVAALEKEVAAYCQTNEAIGCASGSDALLLSLMALNVGPDDEVITTPFSFFATASAIARVGARPVFVDIDPLTWNLDAFALEAKLDQAEQDGTFKGGTDVVATVANDGVGLGKLSAEGQKYADQIKKIQDQIASGEITDIPDTVN